MVCRNARHGTEMKKIIMRIWRMCWIWRTINLQAFNLISTHAFTSKEPLMFMKESRNLFFQSFYYIYCQRSLLYIYENWAHVLWSKISDYWLTLLVNWVMLATFFFKFFYCTISEACKKCDNQNFPQMRFKTE